MFQVINKLYTIEARIRQVEAATDLEEAVKAELLSLYRQTLEHLKVAESWAAKLAQLEQGRLTGGLAQLLYEGDNSVQTELARAIGRLEPLIRWDQGLNEAMEQLDSAQIQVAPTVSF